MTGILSGIVDIPFIQTGSWLPIVVACFFVIIEKGFSIQIPRYFWLLFVLLIWLIVGVMYSSAPSYAVWKTAMFGFFWIALGLCLLRLGTVPGLVNSFFLGILIGTVLSVPVLIVELGSPLAIIGETSRFYRLHLGEGNPIMFSQHLGIAVIINTGFVLTRKPFQWPYLLGSLLFSGLLLLYMLLTGSKGPFVALIFGIIILAWLFNFKRYLLILVSLLSLPMYYFVQKISGEFLSHRYNLADSGSVTSRIDIISDAISISLTTDIGTFLFGAGTGNFGFFYSHADQRMYPHNIIAEILYENGMVGAALLTIILVYPLISVFRFTRKNRGFTLSNTGQCLSISTALYIFSVTNAQISGDIATNFNIGIFGCIVLASVQLARFQIKGQL
ncbi:MAG: hypothetical protein BA863_01370 [Desulfovibrio sp. S3730MH75]|nr:MAG: hypothetical protein BA863_01370 [Desulfovibrio sp. S3730MH75]